MNTFYMVFVEGKSGSTKKHETFEQAHNEAERLREIEKDKNIYMLKEEILQAIAGFERTVITNFNRFISNNYYVQEFNEYPYYEDEKVDF